MKHNGAILATVTYEAKVTTNVSFPLSFYVQHLEEKPLATEYVRKVRRKNIPVSLSNRPLVSDRYWISQLRMISIGKSGHSILLDAV